MNIRYKSTTRLIIAAILSIALYFFVIDPIFNVVKYRHKAVFYDYRQYIWLFNDSVQKEIKSMDSLLSSHGRVRKGDKCYDYILKKGVYVSIWEIKDLQGVQLDRIKFIKNANFSTFKRTDVTILNESSKYLPTTTIKFELPFHSFLTVNFSDDCKIKNFVDTVTCKAFLGDIYKISMSNKEGDHLILFDLSKKPDAIVVFCKKEEKFLIIFITSANKVNESYINLLKL